MTASTPTAAAPPADDVADLAAWAQRRDEAAFQALVVRHGGLVRGVCRRRLGDPIEADAAAQTVFVLLARRGAAIDPARLASWLYGVSIRTCATAARDAARRAGYERKAEVSDGDDGDRDDPWDAVRPRLDEALASLRDDERAILLARYVEDRGHGEIAAALGISPDAAKKRVHAALDRLHAWFGRRGLKVGAALLAAGLARSAADAAEVAAGWAAGASRPGAATAAVARAVERSLRRVTTVRAIAVAGIAAAVAIAAITLVAAVDRVASVTGTARSGDAIMSTASLAPDRMSAASAAPDAADEAALGLFIADQQLDGMAAAAPEVGIAAAAEALRRRHAERDDSTADVASLAGRHRGAAIFLLAGPDCVKLARFATERIAAGVVGPDLRGALHLRLEQHQKLARGVRDPTGPSTW